MMEDPKSRKREIESGLMDVFLERQEHGLTQFYLISNMAIWPKIFNSHVTSNFSIIKVPVIGPVRWPGVPDQLDFVPDILRSERTWTDRVSLTRITLMFRRVLKPL